MTNQAQKFWLETPLNNVKKLMDQTFSYAQDGDDLADMYMEDLNDFKKAVALFRNSDCEGLAEFLCGMDTSPRENLVEAFYFDCGREFVEKNLGFEMSESWYQWQAEMAS
jgi:hypothetical protein